MKDEEISSCLLAELGKLVLRSDEKTQSIQEGARKFLNTHSHAFSDVKTLSDKLETESQFSEFARYLFGEEKEPCYLPFTPGKEPSAEAANGFLVHIFKGEQDIVPLAKDKISITQKQYYRLIHTLRHDLKRLEAPPTLETWQYLLQRYAKWIPAGSSYSHVSLYDYIRVKMSLCACIGEEQLQRWVEKHKAGEPCDETWISLYALKIVGRERLFTLLNLGSNLKGIKGSSFYMQMLREFVEKDILAALNLPLFNSLYGSDDKLLLMVPANMEEKIRSHQTRLEGFLLRHFGGILGLASHIMPLPLTELKDGDFTRVWDRLWAAVIQEQSTPWAHYLGESPKEASLLFGPRQDEKYYGECLAKLSQSCEQLGDTLGKTRWGTVGTRPAQEKIELVADWQDTLSHFKTCFNLLPKKPEAEAGVGIWRFGNTDFACPQGMGFKFSETLPYLMSEQQEIAEATTYWTVIHIQVDRISPKEKHTMWSYLTVHEYLQDFFRTYLSSLLREKKYRRYTYALYAADHRVSLVCSPQIALALVNQIYQKFRVFTGENFTLSGRISVFPSEYPLQQALQEEQKKLVLQSNLENRITVMEEHVSWNFLESILRTQEKLSTIAKLKGKRFLFPLWGIAERYRVQGKKSKNKKDVQMWRHMVGYYLTRLGITDNLEVERGPVHLAMAIRWNYLMSQNA